MQNRHSFVPKQGIFDDADWTFRSVAERPTAPAHRDGIAGHGSDMKVVRLFYSAQCFGHVCPV